jgi:integrase
VDQAQWFWANGLGRLNSQTLVFERGGEAWVPNTFGTTFIRTLRDAGVPHVRLHDLRHSFDLKTVSTALGHSTISTTADIYAHVTDCLMRNAADRIDDAVTVALRKAAKVS